MVNYSDYVPRRGDVVWITFDPQAGHEQAGRRPAVVISPENYNGTTNLAILCPITSRFKNYAFEVPVPQDLPVTGYILTDQLKNLDWLARRAEFACRLPAATVSTVLQRLGLLIK